MRERFELCCSGDLKMVGNRCVRNLLDSTPPPTPKRGCRAAVRKTSLGISVSCGCFSKKPVDIDFFIARQVDDCCLTKCVQKNSAQFCYPGLSKEAMRKKIVKQFSKCCGKGHCDRTKSVGTKSLNGGHTCGLNLKFSKPNSVDYVFDEDPLRSDCYSS